MSAVQLPALIISAVLATLENHGLEVKPTAVCYVGALNMKLSIEKIIA